MNRFLKLTLLICILLAGSHGYAAKKKPYTYPDAGISVEDLKNTVRFLSEIKFPRNYQNVESLEQAVGYISDRFSAYGLEPESQKFEVSGITYENVLAGVGPVKAPHIIVGAHYDVCDYQPGADDNASAIAGLLEIARFAKQHEKVLQFRIDFVAYANEEPPFFGTTDMGSYVHAKYLHDHKITVKGMICLEMIGYFTDAEKSQRYPLSLMKWFYPSEGNFIAVVGNFSSSGLVKQVSRHLKTASIPVEILKAPAMLTGVDFSDHRNYWAFGFDAVMVTDTSFYRNPNYHQRSDTLDTLDFNKMREVVKGVCWSILNLE